MTPISHPMNPRMNPQPTVLLLLPITADPPLPILEAGITVGILEEGHPHQELR